VPKILLYIIIILPAILIGLGLALYLLQEHLVFNPDKLSDKFKYKFAGDFEEINFEMDDGEIINALLFKAENSKGVIFYHHGNSGSLESWGLKAIDFTAENYDVLMYDYRGFGKSTGKIKNEKMLYNDALTLYKKLLYDYKERDIIIYGISLGTGVATKLAHENNPSKLILETPYFNFYDVAKFHYPYFPNTILLHYQFKTDKLLPELKMPIYLFHGTEDETVPYNSSERLVKLSENISLFTIKDGSHNDLNTFHDYHDNLKTILKG
jgi:pimeloyl-ACP methyl ester carboxylesterase